MDFNSHYNLVGKHAFLSASKPYWLNYDDEKLSASYLSAMAAARGTALHQLAHDAIKLGVKFGRSKTTMNMYVNDAIGYRMVTEQILYYTDNCYGTADTMSFRKNLLRIHDLKTGVTATDIRQLKIYAALFCLEYRYKPFDIGMELRIYQNDDIQTEVPEPDEIAHIMDRIITCDKRVEAMKAEALS